MGLSFPIMPMLVFEWSYHQISLFWIAKIILTILSLDKKERNLLWRNYCISSTQSLESLSLAFLSE